MFDGKYDDGDKYCKTYLFVSWLILVNLITYLKQLRFFFSFLYICCIFCM